MEEEVLQRLHQVIQQYESNSKPITWVQECFKFLYDEVINATVPVEDRSPWTLATSLETQNLLLKMALILSDQSSLVSKLGSAAGTFLTITTSDNSAFAMRAIRNGGETSLGSLRISSDFNSTQVPKSVLKHFQSFGEALVLLVRNVAANRSIDLSTCVYKLFDDPPAKFPVVLNINSVEKVQALVLFWLSAVKSYCVRDANISNSRFHAIFLDPLLTVIEKAAQIGLNLHAMSEIITCCNWQFANITYEIAVTSSIFKSLLMWVGNVLQDLREGPGYDQNDFMRSFEIFFLSLTKLFNTMLALNSGLSQIYLCTICKLLDVHIVSVQRAILTTSRVAWREISSYFVSMGMSLLEACINDSTESLPSSYFILACIIDARTHHAVTKCIMRMLSRVSSTYFELHLKSILISRSSRRQKAHDVASRAKRAKFSSTALSLEARLGFSDSYESSDDDASQEHEEAKNSLNIPFSDPKISSLEMEFYNMIEFVEKETFMDSFVRLEALVICEMSFQYGERLFDAYSTIVNAILNNKIHSRDPLGSLHVLNRSSAFEIDQELLAVLSSINRLFIFQRHIPTLQDFLRSLAAETCSKLLPYILESPSRLSHHVNANNIVHTIDRVPETVDDIERWLREGSTISFFVPLLVAKVEAGEMAFISKSPHSSSAENLESITYLLSQVEASQKVALSDAFITYAYCRIYSDSHLPYSTSMSSIEKIAHTLLKGSSRGDASMSPNQLLCHLETLKKICTLCTDVILSGLGGRRELAEAYSHIHKNCVHTNIFDVDLSSMDAHQKLLYCQLFCVVHRSCIDFGLGKSVLANKIFLDSLLPFATEISIMLANTWEYYSQFLMNFFKHPPMKLTSEVKVQILTITSLIREIRLLSAIVNSVLLSGSDCNNCDSGKSRCIVGMELDVEIDNMIAYPHHTHQTRRLFAGIMAISLCEAQLYGTKAGREEKKIIYYISKTLRIFIDHKKKQYDEEILKDDENLMEDNLSWSIVPALGIFIKFTAFLWPEKALWGVTVLVDHWATLTTIQGGYQDKLEEPLYFYYR